MRIPYWIVPLVGVLWLAAGHVRSARASPRSKRMVVVLTALSLLVVWRWPGSVPATLFQVAICVYVLTYQVVTGADDKGNEPLSGKKSKTSASDAGSEATEPRKKQSPDAAAGDWPGGSRVDGK